MSQNENVYCYTSMLMLLPYLPLVICYVYFKFAIHTLAYEEGHYAVVCNMSTLDSDPERDLSRLPRPRLFIYL